MVVFTLLHLSVRSLYDDDDDDGDGDVFSHHFPVEICNAAAAAAPSSRRRRRRRRVFFSSSDIGARYHPAASSHKLYDADNDVDDYTTGKEKMEKMVLSLYECVYVLLLHCVCGCFVGKESIPSYKKKEGDVMHKVSLPPPFPSTQRRRFQKRRRRRRVIEFLFWLEDIVDAHLLVTTRRRRRQLPVCAAIFFCLKMRFSPPGGRS